ncbi:TPA: pentapeptide repeat-containing protein [Escherichia coli]|uniref:pentapeptide repeat-containing protein n=1 Tax=Escherichia coli TaxID=562 RepID=UPI0017696C8C|nr:pentapeptide repeat-containing protein [Escherichia coli]MCB4687496.1 pentapeptide repeat-containing protein [Escherichia coli]MCC4717010.1 pentapeptide repeat-containing protein [Escherichia coli]MEC6385663.1 pentapeptide repeat-containing protein [Escherichia coli]HAH4329055.1 pentapeptide repeat-containing protein [Escherichia coli]HAH4419270.1 pentapeptide repeat-containing protein [Escherichia coli]
MINNISDQASSFPGTQLNQSDNFLDSLREFFAILNSSRKGELSTWDTIYLHLILAINADSDLIKNDVLLAENMPSANYQFNTFFSNAFETDVKKYLGKSEDNEVEIKAGNERISIGIRNVSNGKLERQQFLFPLDYENKLQDQLDKHFTIESHPLLYRHTIGSKIANVIFEKLYSRIDFNKEQYISFIKGAFIHFYDYSRRYAISENIEKDAVTNNIALMNTFYDSDNTSGEVLNNDFTEEESFETALDVEHTIVLGFADDNFETKPVHYQDLLTRFSAFQDTVFNLFPEMRSSHYHDICSVCVDMTKGTQCMIHLMVNEEVFMSLPVPVATMVREDASNLVNLKTLLNDGFFIKYSHFNDVALIKQNISNLYLSHTVVNESILKKCCFENGSLGDVKITNSNIINNVFKNVSFRSVKINNVNTHSLKFINCHFFNVDMIRVNFSKCLFHDCSMHGVKIKPWLPVKWTKELINDYLYGCLLSLYSICARDIYNMSAGNNVKVAADAFLEIIFSLKNKYCIKLLSAQDRAFIYEFARMIFAYINDKSIEILLLSCFAASDQKAIQRYIPQSQDGEDFRSHLQYKLPLSAH